MRIALGQLHMNWEDKDLNKIKCERFIQEASANCADFIVFPEMTLSGFSMNVEEIAERAEESATLFFFKKMSRIYDMTIGFGYAEKTEGKARNKMIVVQNGRIILDYTKLHPFSMGEEGQYFEGGTKLSAMTVGGVNFGAFVCYDLRFPEIFTASARFVHAILVIANWPASRDDHWRALLKARAIETQCYIIGVNCVGEIDGIKYRGSSMILDPYGVQITPDMATEGIIIGDIDPYLVEEYRKDFPVLADRRPEFYRELL